MYINLIKSLPLKDGRELAVSSLLKSRYSLVESAVAITCVVGVVEELQYHLRKITFAPAIGVLIFHFSLVSDKVKASTGMKQLAELKKALRVESFEELKGALTNIFENLPKSKGSIKDTGLELE